MGTSYTVCGWQTTEMLTLIDTEEAVGTYLNTAPNGIITKQPFGWAYQNPNPKIELEHRKQDLQAKYTEGLSNKYQNETVKFGVQNNTSRPSFFPFNTGNITIA